MYAKLLSGDTLRAQGKYEEASRAFEEALAIRDAWLAHFGLARTRLAAGDRAQAERELGVCELRRGEGAFAFSSNVPTLRLVAHVTRQLARENR